MMDLPIFTILNSNTTITSKLKSDNVLRVFEFGMATENVKFPYVVWQVISGQPYNNLDCPPPVDKVRVQFDVYGTTGAESKNIAKLVRLAIEQNCYIIDMYGTFRDTDGIYTTQFDTSWHVPR